MKRDERLQPFSRDHHAGLVFATRLAKHATEASADKLEELAQRTREFWETELLGHFRAEEEVLLPRLWGLKDEENLVLKTLQQHISIHRWVNNAADTNDEAERREALKRLAQELTDHIHFEERVLFPWTEKALSEEKLDLIGRELAARERGRDTECPLPVKL